MQLIPQLRRTRFLRTVHILRRDKPPLDRPERQEAAPEHEWNRREQVDPPGRLEHHLQPDDHERQREGHDAEREEGRAVIGSGEPVIQVASLAFLGDLQPGRKHLSLAAAWTQALPSAFHDPAEFVGIKLIGHVAPIANLDDPYICNIACFV